MLGYAWFANGGHDAAFALMYAAGCAYERANAGLWRDTSDARLTRQHLPGRGGFQACVRAADAMLRGLQLEHAAVAAALTHRDISHADLIAFARDGRIRRASRKPRA